MVSRAERRVERYRIATQELGFTASEARQMRDWSAERIRQRARDRRRELSAVPSNQRTPGQQTQLRNIRRFERRQTTDLEFRGAIETTSDREDNWREWSVPDNGFPPRIQAEILAYNELEGLPEFASHGYRIQYARYVLGMTEDDAMEYVRENYDGDGVV